jgi:hypothetical protein
LDFQNYLAHVATDAGAPETLAPQLTIIAESAVTTAAISSTADPAHQACAAARVLIDVSLAPTLHSRCEKTHLWPRTAVGARHDTQCRKDRTIRNIVQGIRVSKRHTAPYLQAMTLTSVLEPARSRLKQHAGFMLLFAAVL